MSEQTAVREPIFPSEKRAVSPQEFLQISESLLPRAFVIHEQKNGPKSKHPQIFHRADKPEDHVRAVERRVGKTIKVINKVAPGFVSLIEEGRGRLFAGMHDWVQERHLVNIGTIQEEIVRERGDNEKENANQAVNFMRIINDENGKLIFVPEDTQVCREVQDATIPAWIEELGTVIQKQLNSHSSIEAKLDAIADTGAAGEDPEQFIREGNWEFQEVKIGITRAINEAPKDENGVPELSDEDKQYVIKQITSWLKRQVNWAEGRKSRKDIEFDYFEDERVIKVLKEEVYNKFDESIAIAKERASDLDKKDFGQLLTLIGYLKPQVLPQAA